MNNNSKINPSIYLKAAELQSEYERYDIDGPSMYSCDNIRDIVFARYSHFQWMEYKTMIDNTLGLYEKYFKPEKPFNDLAWWDTEDNESRIFALLFMHEIAKDLIKGKKKKMA